MEYWVKEASNILSKLHYGKNNVEKFLFALGLLQLHDDVRNSPNQVAYSNVIKEWISAAPPGITRDKSSLCEEIRMTLNWNLAADQITAIQLQIPPSSQPSTSSVIHPQQQDSSGPQESSSSSRIKHTNDETDARILMRKEGMKLKKYETTSHTKGLALILNFINFNLENASDRSGAEKDGKDLRDLFETFNFEVTYKKNATLNDLFDDEFGILPQFIRSFDRYSKATNTPSCFIVISTHGIKNGFLAAKDNWFPFEMITRQLSHSSAPKLKGVPKVVLVNACRGNINLKQPFKFETDAITRGEEKVICDLLISYSTSENFVSSRHIEDGSIFIQKFIQAAKEHYRDMDIEDILKYVTEEILKMCSTEDIAIQITENRNIGFHRKLFFEN